MVRLFLAIFTAPSSYRISAKHKMKYRGERQEEAHRNNGGVIPSISLYMLIIQVSKTKKRYQLYLFFILQYRYISILTVSVLNLYSIYIIS